MNRHAAIRLSICWMLIGCIGSLMAADTPPKRLKRADSFLGIHFDFHANTDCTEVGKNTTPAMIENIINLVHPDYLQIDCKGHPGYSSYPTKVGHQAPGIIGDPLHTWREVTAQHGVALYMHYSGVYDMQAVREPGWAAINADGTSNKRATSFFGPYADKLLIPQLCELAGQYGADGAWVDGECWAAVPDYSEAALAAFRKTTGITDIPKKPSDPHWFEFLQFNRELFRKYLRHYIVQVKKANPRFQLCSNWAYTDHMAEPVSAPLDFLSGDYAPQDSVNSARLSARYLARQGKPWDLMAWSFTTKPGKDGRKQKSAVQLEREAAVVLAQGGGFEAYFKQKRDGSIYDEQMPMMAEVAKFCRARQAICHHAQGVPQVGLLLSTADQYRRINGLYSRELVRINGVLQALLESQYSVEVLGEHQLAGRLAEYPILILPECKYLEPKFRNSLAAYAKAGGSLLLIGSDSAKLFEHEIGLKAQKEAKSDVMIELEHKGKTTRLKTQIQEFDFGPDAVSFGRVRETNTANGSALPAAAIVKFGRGRIAATSFTIGQAYLTEQSDVLRQYLDDLTGELFPRPVVSVKGSHDVEVSLMRNHGKLLINLVNTAGPHRTEPILDTIPTVGPLDIGILLAKKPAAITLEPEGKSVDFAYQKGQVRFSLPKLDIHEVISIQAK